MKPDSHVDKAKEQVEALREGSAAGLLGGLLILVLLAGSAVLVTYFWPVVELAAPEPVSAVVTKE